MKLRVGDKLKCIRRCTITFEGHSPIRSAIGDECTVHCIDGGMQEGEMVELSVIHVYDNKPLMAIWSEDFIMNYFELVPVESTYEPKENAEWS